MEKFLIKTTNGHYALRATRQHQRQLFDLGVQCRPRRTVSPKCFPVFQAFCFFLDVFRFETTEKVTDLSKSPTCKTLKGVIRIKNSDLNHPNK